MQKLVASNYPLIFDHFFSNSATTNRFRYVYIWSNDSEEEKIEEVFLNFIISLTIYKNIKYKNIKYNNLLKCV